MKNFAMPRRQDGVVLFVAMIALVVLMIAAVALIRSTDTAQMVSGNLAVKRDMTHESEQAIQAAIANFTGAGTLSGESTRLNDNAGVHYYASAQPSNAMGIPTELVAAASSGETAAYAASGVTYRYIIDRMCPTAGQPLNCMTGRGSAANNFINDVDASANAGKGLGTKDFGAVYRISVRLTDPRKTQSFFQTTFMSRGS